MFFKPKSFIGVDIGAGGIKMVELKKEKGRPVLFTYGLTSEKHDVHDLSPHQSFLANKGLEPLNLQTTEKEKIAKLEKQTENNEEKIDDYARKIKKLYIASKATAKTVVVSLPVSSIFHAIVTLPVVAKKDELDRLLKAEVKKFISFLEKNVL